MIVVKSQTDPGDECKCLSCQPPKPGAQWEEYIPAKCMCKKKLDKKEKK